MDLTLTRVVFESFNKMHVWAFIHYLTLTRVVFEC